MHTTPPPPQSPPPWSDRALLYGPHLNEVVKEPRRPVKLTWPLVGTTALAALVGDLAFQQPAINTLAAFIFVCAAALATITTGGIRTGYGRLFLAAAVIFAGFLTVRSEPRLIVFDVIAAYTLLIAAAVFGRGGNPWDIGPVTVGATAIKAVRSWFELGVDVPLDVSARTREFGDAREDFRSSASAVGRGIVVAIPVLVILGLLLASADAVFASFFDLAPLPIDRAVIHASFFILSATLLIVVQQRAKRQPVALDQRSRLSLGSVEASVVLIGLDLLFGLFALAQVLVLFGDGEQAVIDAGMTYSGYARNGFFQLLWVAGITLVTLMGLRTLTAESDRHHRLLRGLSQLASVMTLGIVAVAIQRLSLYIADTGLTPLRFYSSVFSLWVGIAFIIVMIRTAGYRSTQAWLTPVLLASGLITLLGLNLANPEAIIASTNLTFDEEPGLSYQHVLTADGIVILADRIEEVPESERAETTNRMCARQGEFPDRGVLAFNLSQRRAHEALEKLCP